MIEGTIRLGRIDTARRAGEDWAVRSKIGRCLIVVIAAFLGLAAYFVWAWRAVQPTGPRLAVVESVLSGESPVVGHSAAVETGNDTK